MQTTSHHGVGFEAPLHARTNSNESLAAVRKLISKEIAVMSEAQCVQHCRSPVMSGKSITCVSILPNVWTIRHLVASTVSDRMIKFRAEVQVKMLPSDGNLMPWRRCPTVRTHWAMGQACSQAQPSMEHALAGCPAVELHQGHITWQHKSVLLVLNISSYGTSVLSMRADSADGTCFTSAAKQARRGTTVTMLHSSSRSHCTTT